MSIIFTPMTMDTYQCTGRETEAQGSLIVARLHVALSSFLGFNHLDGKPWIWSVRQVAQLFIFGVHRCLGWI